MVKSQDTCLFVLDNAFASKAIRSKDCYIVYFQHFAAF